MPSTCEIGSKRDEVAEFLYSKYTDTFRGQAPLKERLMYPPFLVTVAIAGVMVHLNRDAFGWMASAAFGACWDVVFGGGGEMRGGGESMANMNLNGVDPGVAGISESVVSAVTDGAEL